MLMTGGRVLSVAAGLVLLSGFLLPAQAAPWETLPPDHWAYEEIRWLQTLGYLQDLDPLQKPYTYGEIAEALKNTTLPQEQPARGRFEWLQEEFSGHLPVEDDWQVRLGGRLFAGLENSGQDKWDEAGYAVATISVGNDRMGVHTALRGDHDLSKNPGYKGKVWGDMTGLAEQAYFVVQGESRRWELKIGRDHLYWGAGRDHLVLNHAARGIDQISFRVHWQWGQFTALAGQVDDWTEETGDRISRFLSGHRLELQPWRWLRLGLSETLLFTGGVRLGSFNPFVPYYAELVNETSAGNGLLGFDFIAYPADGFALFGELLVDDIQLEQKDSRDNEPAEWGWLIGGSWHGLNGLLGVEAGYRGISARTYNAIEPKYRYLNYGLPLGSDLGNDADQVCLQLSGWPEPRIRIDLFWSYLRQGEGRVSAPFDTSYLAYTVEEGYSEPFPTGTVEKTHTLGLGLSVRTHTYFEVTCWVGQNWITNVHHFEDWEDEQLTGRVTANIRLHDVIGF